MAKKQNLIQRAYDFLTAKSYMGILPGGLPTSSAWSGADYLKANDISLYTHKALAKRAEKVAEVKFVLYDKKGEIVEDNEMLNLFAYPNQYHSGIQFWYLYQQHLDLMGSAYILLDAEPVLFEKKPKIAGMHLLRPDMVKVVLEEGKVVKYEYRGPNGKTTEYEPWQIVRIFRPDPSNPLQGMSLLKAGITAIQTEVQIASYHARILENGGKVDGVFKFKTPRLTKEQLQQLKDSYEKEIADARNSGKPLFLGGDAEYTRMGMTPDEVAFIDTKRVTLQDICIMTGVPKELLGSMDGTKYDNADASIRIFLRETIKPQLASLVSALDNALIPDEYTLGFIDPTPENVEEKMKALEMAMSKGLITTNEGRRVLARLIGEELEDVDGGDDILINFNLIPLGSSSVVEKAAKETDKKKVKTADVEHPLRDATARSIYFAMQNKRLDRRTKLFMPVLQTYLNGQRERLVEKLQPNKSRVFRKKDLIDDNVDLELEVKIGKDAFLPVLQAILAESGQDAMQLVGSTYAFTLTAEIVAHIENKADVFLRQINETTLGQLKRQFEQSMAENEGRAQLIERIQGVYEDISVGRANVIARTEVHGAVQYGTWKGYKQAGMGIKIWVSVLDKETRSEAKGDEADHVVMDGEEQPMDMPFSNGLMYPGEAGASPAEVVNCRCTI